jgi:hypothetical protein
LTEPVHSGLFFSLFFSNPPLPLFHPFVTSHYPIWLAQLCVRVCVYICASSAGLLLPPSRRPIAQPIGRAPFCLSLLFYFLLFLKNQIENNRKIFFQWWTSVCLALN